MKYFSFHLGDYSTHTSHLEPMEDLAYRRMIDLYYLTESPLPADWRELSRLIRMRDHGPAIEAVLTEFFVLTDAGWTNLRCDAEIARFKEKSEKASKAGKLSAERRFNACSTDVQRTFNGNSTDVQLTKNQEPRTNNQEPKRESARVEKAARGSRLPKDWIMSDAQESFCKQERPSLDPSTVACRFRDYWHAAAGKSGVKLDWDATWRNWVRNEREPAQAKAQQLSFRERDEQAAIKRWEEMTGRVHPDRMKSGDVIEMDFSSKRFLELDDDYSQGD